ncbi:MAG: response regulator [Desulfobacterales bacterium]|nr:response regulator [Desulfobacterales bacterium]
MENKKTILIVDDEMDMRIFLSTLVETSGYKPIVCRDGSEGIEKALKIKPSLIILDVMMPKEGGVHMYYNVRTNHELKNTPIIILSAIAQKTFNHYIKMLNVRTEESIPAPEAYMEKPPEAEELIKIIKELIGQ